MGETSKLRGKYKGLLPPSHTLLADRERHSDYDLAFQMNCDFHRVENQRGTITQMFAQLAAKDAEIAELRAKLVGYDELCSTSVGGYDAGIPALVAATTEITSLIAALQGADRDYLALRGERDEARECVGRLWPFIVECGGAMGRAIDGNALAKSANTIIAATPEHLRAIRLAE